MLRAFHLILVAMLLLAVSSVSVMGVSLGYWCEHHAQQGESSHCHIGEAGAFEVCETQNLAECEEPVAFHTAVFEQLHPRGDSAQPVTAPLIALAPALERWILQPFDFTLLISEEFDDSLIIPSRSPRESYLGATLLLI